MRTLDLETRVRSFVKAICWRVVAGVITTSIAWIVTGKIAFAAAIGFLDTFVKVGAYYLHERAWNNVRFGRGAPADYEI